MRPGLTLCVVALGILTVGCEGVVGGGSRVAEASSDLERLTDEAVAAIGAYQRSSEDERGARGERLGAILAERRAVVLATLDASPALVLQHALPNGLTSGLPEELRALVEREVDAAGFLGAQIAEKADHEALAEYVLQANEGVVPGAYQVRAVSAAELELACAAKVGQRVTLRALQLDGVLLLVGPGALQPSDEVMLSDSAAAITGTHSTLVLLGHLSDRPLDSSCTPSYVQNLMYGGTGSVNDLFDKTSKGAVRFSGPVHTEILQLTNTSTASTDFWAIGDEMDRLAAAKGIDVRAYGKTMYVIPQVTSGYIGMALISVGSAGSFYRAWVMTCSYPDVYAHELGHLIGFWHSGTPGSEYGDTSDIMGSGGLPLRHFSAARRAHAGWLGASALSVGASGTFTVDANGASAPVNPQALVLAKPDTSESYYVSLRQAVSYDTGLASKYLDRVSVHRASTPNVLSTLMATLGVGETYTDSVNGYVFTVAGITSGSATVSVSTPPPVCARANPTVSLTPLTQSAAPGAAVTYQVTVTSRNSAACGTSTFALVAQLPDGWTSGFSPASLALDSGATGTAVWTVTSPAGALEQSFAVRAVVTDTASASITATVQGSYVVTTPDSSPPQVAITAPADGAAVSGSVPVSATASDNRGVAKVEFWIDGVLVYTDTSSPYGFSWNARKLSGSSTLTARASDAAGNSTAASVTVTVIKKTGGRR